ncbi:hypothetical protein [Burkholderia ubonensis]|uniref:hypothetical protein n=1 Tax=Burkholderia ubonensis TaxID=101571 RepID=UPI0012F87706|nr:hypothetical protein [Burkholderia ubonensis]
MALDINVKLYGDPKVGSSFQMRHHFALAALSNGCGGVKEIEILLGSLIRAFLVMEVLDRKMAVSYLVPALFAIRECMARTKNGEKLLLLDKELSDIENSFILCDE